MTSQRVTRYTLFALITTAILALDAEDGKPVLDRSTASTDANGNFRVSNYEFKCFQQLASCSAHGWTLRFKLRLNPSNSCDRERKHLLFSTGADQPFSDGLVVYLYQSKNTSYLEFGLKEFHNDQVAFYWPVEADLELRKWVDIVITIGTASKAGSTHHQMTIFFDGYVYKKTDIEKYTEQFIFKYDKIHARTAMIYGNDSEVAMLKDIVYYERLLTDEEISNVSAADVDIGCLKATTGLQQYIIPETFDSWRECRDECHQRADRIAFYSPSDGRCGCISTSQELDLSFQYHSKCTCSLTKHCSNSNEWHVILVTRVINLVDTEVGLEIRMADASYLTHSRTRVQRQEGVEIVVSVKNERNLASLTMYGDIEGQDPFSTNISSNEIYITAGVVHLSWKNEGAKKVQFRADYRRMVRKETAEYRTVYVDVVFVKTDLPVQFLQLSPDTPDYQTDQNFTVQAYGSVPINCTLDSGDGHQQTSGTNRHQYYTAYFGRNYTRYGQYNVTVQCYNERSKNSTQITRTIRRNAMNKKMIIHTNVMETSEPARLNIVSRDDYYFRHSSCLRLRNVFTNASMALIWRKKMLEVIPTEPIPTGRYFYQLECDATALQPYILNVQPAVRSVELMASKTTLKSGQSTAFSLTLEPTVDVTVIFDCGADQAPLTILHIPEVSDLSPIHIGNCTYADDGQFHAMVSVMNLINVNNHSQTITVEPPLSPFRVEVENRSDVNQLTSITIRTLEKIPFEGVFTLTIRDYMNEKNQTRTELVKLLRSNNFTEHIHMNITTYGKQILHVQGGDFPTVREAQASFVIGTEITTKPQVYIVNQIGFVHEDLIWIDVQWVNGIGFDIEVNFASEKKILIRYGQFASSAINRTMKKVDGAHEIQWKRVAKQRLQVGYRFTNTGTFQIDVTFIQPSSKRLPVSVKCPWVTIVPADGPSRTTCFDDQQFHLTSPYAFNNITSTSSVLLLPYRFRHDLEPRLNTMCTSDDLVYSFYLLSIDSSQWKFSRTQRYANSHDPAFQDTFLDNYCSRFGTNAIMTIEEKSLAFGYYMAVFTIGKTSNMADFRQFVQPIEIIRSDLVTTFGGNETITKDVNELLLDFYPATIDPDHGDFDRRKLNFTLLCYPEHLQSSVFQPATIQLGSSRPTETNPQNHNQWSIQWANLQLAFRRTDIHVQFYENQCFLPKRDRNAIQFDAQTKSLKIDESALKFGNGTLHFLLIVRHLMDGRQLIARLEVDKEILIVFETANLNALEEVMGNLDDLAAANPKKAVELITGLADKLNEMSDNSTAAETSEADLKAMNERMAAMRAKMLTSMDTVIDSASDPGMVDKALKASATVTANSDQMPLDNQEKGASIIEKVGAKVKEMETADEKTVTGLATSLMDVGGNVLQAASKTVGKDKGNDPAVVIDTLQADMQATEDEETDTKVLYAPTQFYDACDDCDMLPEERWEQYRQQLEEEKKKITEGRERASSIAKRSSSGLFTVGDVLANRSSTNESKTIESKTMAMTFTKASPDGKSSLSAGSASIRLPGFSDLNSDPGSSNVFTKVLESKENPYASTHGNTSIEGSVVTIILSRPDGSEMPVQNTTKPISIRLARPADKQPKEEQHELFGTAFQYHKVQLPEKEMTLSLYIAPSSSPSDAYGVYIAFGTNETLLEPPTESKFDLLFVAPNRTALNSTAELSAEDEEEIRHTVLLTPDVHLGNGTYIIGIKLINATTTMNLTEYNSSYSIRMYVSKCQYWDEKRFVWSSAGCKVGPLTTLKSTECLCTHLTTFGSDFYVPPNTIDFKTVFTKFKTLHENAAVFSTVIVIFGLYILAAIWARRKDRRDLVKWTAAPLIDNLPIDTYHYLITVHTGVGKESGTTSNISFVISGESSDSGVRKLSDGKNQEFAAGSVRNFVMSVEVPLGSPLYLRIWHDNSGQKGKASWFLNMVNIMDLQTGEKNYFICDNWLAVEKGDGLVDRVVPLASSKELKSFAHLFTQSVKKKFSDGHLWYSVFSRPVRSNFTRLQRVSCCISLLFCTMISNAMFYRQDTQGRANKAGVLMKIGPIEFTLTQLWISFISTMVVLPVNLLIVTLFRKAKNSQKILISHHLEERKRRNRTREEDEQCRKTRNFFARHRRPAKRANADDAGQERIAAIPSLEDKTRTFPHWTIYIAWILVTLSILTCSFFIILYSLEWGAKRANEWLVTMMLSFGQSILVIDPLKVFFITAIISFLIRRPYDDETLDFNDPFTGSLISNTNIAQIDGEDVYSANNVKEIARQRRVRLFNLRPINSNEMARAREQRLQEIKMGEVIREIVIYVFFTVVLLFLSYQSRDTNSYGLYRDTKNLFITGDFEDVASITNWWDYCDNVLLKGLYAQKWYNEKNLTWREKLTTGSRASMRVGAPRIRQLRVKENSCRVHRRVKHVIKHCRDDYNWIDDDTKDYTAGWAQVLNKTSMRMFRGSSNKTKRCTTPWCYQSSARTKSGPLTALYKTYKGGGYVVSLGRTNEKAASVMAQLRSQNWLDQLTRAIIIDFSLYNANVNLFASVTLSFEMTSMGSVIQDYQIKIFRLYDHIGGYGMLVYIFELLFVLFTIYSTVHELILLVKQKREYFHKFWNTISFLVVVFSIASLIMYAVKKSLTRLAIRSLKKTEMDEFVNFNAIASFDEVYSYIVALITFFTMLKFLKLLRFNKRIDMLSKSLRYARRDLGSFAFVFLIFIVAYAQMGFALFGRTLDSYKSFATALTTCFRMLLGEINAPAMLAVSRLYGAFYFLSFIMLVFIALLSIFLTILNDSFAHVKRELAAGQHTNAMVEFMWSTFRKVAGINNRKGSAANEDEISVDEEKQVPLAEMDGDEL